MPRQKVGMHFAEENWCNEEAQKELTKNQFH